MENGLCHRIETVYWSLIGVGPTCGAKGVHRTERMRRVTRTVGALTSEAGAQYASYPYRGEIGGSDITTTNPRRRGLTNHLRQKMVGQENATNQTVQN